MAPHVRQGLTETHAILLYKAHDLRNAVEEFLLNRCGVRAVEAVGDYRRCVEIIEELALLSMWKISPRWLPSSNDMADAPRL